MTNESLQEGKKIWKLIEEYEETICNLSIKDTCKATLLVDGRDEDVRVENHIDVPEDCLPEIVHILQSKYTALLNEAKTKFESL